MKHPELACGMVPHDPAIELDAVALLEAADLPKGATAAHGG
ncbi:hypothetical protein [Rhodococcus sp. BP22]|nr:hypothetical protein [Rhodococcus sp. BP22]